MCISYKITRKRVKIEHFLENFINFVANCVDSRTLHDALLCFQLFETQLLKIETTN